MNVSFNMLITNIDRIHDMAFNNKIRIQLLWEDSHPGLASLRRVGSNKMLEGLL